MALLKLRAEFNSMGRMGKDKEEEAFSSSKGLMSSRKLDYTNNSM
jgi:hypothetical protein